MPDLTTSFERFKDELSRQRQEFNQHMAKIEGQNKELERTFDGKISELIDLQKESLRSQKEQASLEKIRGKEEDIESGRASKSRESTADDIGETKEHSKNIAGGIKSIAASFMNPKLLAGMFALAIADAMTKVNLTGTAMAAAVAAHSAPLAGTAITKAGSNIKAGRAAKVAAKSAAATAAADARALQVMNTPRHLLHTLPPPPAAAVASKGNILSRGANAASRAGSAAAGTRVGGVAVKAATGAATGIMASLRAVGSVLGPIVKVLGKIALPLAIVLSILDAVFTTEYDEDMDIGQRIGAFLMTALDDFIVGFIDGFTQLVAWTSDVIADLPYYFGELIDGLMEFVSGMFSGDFLSTIFYAFANLGVELWGLIGNVIKLLWEIPWVIITKTWAWMTKLADRAWDMIKLKTGFMSQEAFDAKTLKDEQAEKALQAKEAADREKLLASRAKERDDRKLGQMTVEDRRKEMRRRRKEKLAAKEAESDKAAGKASESATEAAKSTEKAADDMKKSVGDLSAMEDELIPQSMLEKSAEFAKGIMGAMGNSVKTVGNLVQGKGIGDMLGGMNQASKRGGARSYGFEGSGSKFGRGSNSGVFGNGAINPNVPISDPGLIPGGPGGIPGMPLFGPGPGADGQGRHLMSNSGSNSMMPPNVIMPISNTTSNQVVHNTSQTTTLASGNIINEDRSIMMSMLHDNIHDSLV